MSEQAPATLLNWVSEEAVLAMHQRHLAEHGGLDGVRDAGLLASPPQHLASYGQPDMAALAAAYAFGVARNHPFVDGNKRTALVVSITFLKINGYDIAPDYADAYLTFLKLASGEIGKEQLADWFRAHLVEPSFTQGSVQEMG